MSQNLWQQLLQQVEEKKPETIEVKPIPQTVELIGTPQTIEQVNSSIFVGGVTIDDDEDENEEDDFEEGVDTPSNNVFNIAGLNIPIPPTPAQSIELLNNTLITPTPQQLNKTAVNDIFNLSGTPVDINTPTKRGPGRPKGSTAKQVIEKLPEKLDTVQEQAKSITDNTKIPSQTQQTTKEVALAIPKTTLLEIGESLSRISAALIAVAKS